MSVSKSLRFSIFARDGFTCRYCGRQSDKVVLEVDHVIPVCKGGTDDESNLVTSCFDCNRGKSGTPIPQCAPTETDRLRMAQENGEQFAVAEKAKKAATDRAQVFQNVCNYVCEIRGQEEFDRKTLNILVKYVYEFGPDLVFSWIDSACYKLPHKQDRYIGMYVSGIRRSYLAEGEAF
jgi:hypothetical protein